MYQFILDIWNSTSSFFEFWYYYITHFPEFYEHYVRLLLKYMTYFMFWFSEQALIMSYEMTQEFLASFNYQQHVASAWNAIPSTPRAILGFFKIPECVNILVSALGTKFVLKFVPFAGF